MLDSIDFARMTTANWRQLRIGIRVMPAEQRTTCITVAFHWTFHFGHTDFIQFFWFKFFLINEQKL